MKYAGSGGPARGSAGVGLAAVLAGALALGACGAETEYTYPSDQPGTRDRPDHSGEERVGVFGPGGLNLFGGGDEDAEAQPGIAVNGFLWRATLDTLSFAPLVSADPFGGVIITDWFVPPESPSERFKMTVYILSRQLRADGLRVAVFRQVRDGADAWVDAEVSPETTTELENTILTRARELRVAGAFQ